MTDDTYRIVVTYDSNDRSFVPFAQLFEDGNARTAVLEIRDYGRGETPDEHGNLYELVDD